MRLSQKLRFFFPAIVYVIVSIMLIYMLWTLAVDKRDFLVDQSKQRIERKRIIAPKRRKILDRNGNILAISLPKMSFWVHPEKLLQSKEGCNAVAKLFKKNVKSFYQQLQQHKNRSFMYLARHLSDESANKIHQKRLDNVYATEEYVRMYPEGRSSAHLLGFTNVDGNGLEGVELAKNEHLLGQAGYAQMIVNRYGQEVETVSKTRAIPGSDVVLSIDKELQHAVYMALEDGVKTAQAESAMAMVVDVGSGDILAAANYPSFDPNTHEKKSIHMRNRVFTDRIEPGSTFKPIAMGYVLDHSKVKLSDVWDTSPGVMQLGAHTVEDVHNYGKLTTEDIMVKSSNIGMSKLILGTTGFPQWLRSELGVVGKTIVGYPGEVTGNVARIAANDTHGLASLSFGYGVNLTVAQLAMYYAAIANDGMLRPLHLVRGDASALQPKRVFSVETAAKLKKMMQMAVSYRGTGRRSTEWGGSVAGKTGTTYLHTPNQGYDKSNYVASFAGFAPVDKPKYAVVVVVNKPSPKRHYGGQVAAPIFSNIMFNAMYLTTGLQNT